MPIPQEETASVSKERTGEGVKNRINAEIREAAKTEISAENKERAGKIVDKAVESAKQVTSLRPDHPFWGEKGRWQEIKQRPNNNPVEEVATVLQVVVSPMKSVVVESYGEVFPPDTTLELALQHIVVARLLSEAKKIGGTSQELPSRLPGLKEDAPSDYLQKIQIISRLAPTLCQNAKTVCESNNPNILNEPLRPGRLQPEGTPHQGFPDTLGSALVQLEHLRAGA
jgi:hypothetical protein